MSLWDVVDQLTRKLVWRSGGVLVRPVDRTEESFLEYASQEVEALATGVQRVQRAKHCTRSLLAKNTGLVIDRAFTTQSVRYRIDPIATDLHSP